MHDPYLLRTKEKKKGTGIINFLVRTGCMVVRIPILPGHYRVFKNYLRDYIDPLVRACGKKGVYCILDWHAIGNPIAGQTRLKEQFHNKNGKVYYFDTELRLCRNAWRIIARRYGQESHVLCEIFNEPAPGNQAVPSLGLSPLLWSTWRSEAIKIIRIIRKHTQNIILVAGTNWAYNLKDIVKNPIRQKNIAYAVHPYPIRKDWKQVLSLIVKKYPLIITEWGFKKNTKQMFMKGSRSGYGLPFVKYCRQKRLSWVAWCYSPSWGPAMLASWNKADYTPWGKFVIKHLRD